MANKTPLFVFDREFNLYEVYQKDEMVEGENRSYRKKINIESVVNSHYDESMQNLMIISKNTINQVRNDKNNNFNIVNGIFFEDFSPIIKSTYCDQTKIITLLTLDQLVYQLRNYEHSI
jgi:hypothetical protein